MDPTWRICLTDTCSPANLINESKLTGIQEKMRPYKGSELQGFGGSVQPKGIIDLTFQIWGSSTVHEAEFLVIPTQMAAIFDVLLGWPWLKEHDYRLVQGNGDQD